ncbi:hypothetical protein [Chitinophaga sp. YIM B06452]|uniref:hypothetical protein n=1 Tax=Chitinophaga sp. YIM B06452 TaxID=3082158 RepID=UPI0031FEED65
MTIDIIIDLLSTFKPFDENDLENDNESYLDEIMTFVKSNKDYKKAFEPIFLLIEKYPNVDLGSPGPLVHTLEEYRGEYESFLIDSLKRRPTSLTAWMLNRIINVEENQLVKKGFIEFMASLLKAENIDDKTRDKIENFVAFQRESLL